MNKPVIKNESVNSKITLFELTRMIFNAYGDNGIVAFCFYLAFLFDKFIMRNHGYFPFLFLYGKQATGKTQIAKTFLLMFGNDIEDRNINHLSIETIYQNSYYDKHRNSLIHFDEYLNKYTDYKDNILYLSEERGGIIVSGTEFPNNISLLSKSIFLPLTKVYFSDRKEYGGFYELKNTENNKDITHITKEIYKHRGYFIGHYVGNYRLAYAEVEKHIGIKKIKQHPIVKNWLIILAAFRTMENRIDTPFRYEYVFQLFVNKMKKQIGEIEAIEENNDLSIFWRIFEDLVRENTIKENYDFICRKSILYLDQSRIFYLYEAQGKKTNQKILHTTSLRHCLINSTAYRGEKNIRFKLQNGKAILKRTLAFDIDLLNLNLINKK